MYEIHEDKGVINRTLKQGNVKTRTKSSENEHGLIEDKGKIDIALNMNRSTDVVV